MYRCVERDFYDYIGTQCFYYHTTSTTFFFLGLFYYFFREEEGWMVPAGVSLLFCAVVFLCYWMMTEPLP